MWMKRAARHILTLLLFLSFLPMRAEDGYELWLRYAPLHDQARCESAGQILGKVVVSGSGPTWEVIREELERAGKGMLGKEPAMKDTLDQEEGFKGDPGLVIGTPATCSFLDREEIRGPLEGLGPEGYYITLEPGREKGPLIIAANDPVGLLYGTFHLLRELQIYGAPRNLPLREQPDFNYRLLNHWDNLDRTVERGYAGFSIWDWHRLPDYIHQRYRDYARANASIGINGAVVTNVNANALVLTPAYMEKVAALADVFRPYGIRIYLTARFSAPAELHELETADPLDPGVRDWWKRKAGEIYEAIPDFGGFLVKANSEGQPGPQNYGRSHADGANMLAEAVAPHGGIVMWRAFVYSAESPEDRAKQAVLEFQPLDGTFHENVAVQVKNGPIDFQPREPFHPLFGSMPETALALELQITQEYLGQGTQLAYLAPQYKECLDAETSRPGPASTVADIVDGSAGGQNLSVLAGVSNIGTDRNWTGHPFGQANWYAFGRLGWDHGLSPEEIADEWIRLTFGQDPMLVENIREIMMASREAIVDYMTPLGLHHIMARGHHYGPGPWVTGGRADWTSVYYHKAGSDGIGFDRTASGSNAVGQYAPEIATLWSDPATVPDQYLLWFHHLPWDYRMASGNILWDELCIRYDRGVKEARRMKSQWKELEGNVDRERFEGVLELLGIQVKEAEWWRNACLLYFQQYSGMPFPGSIETPEGNLEEYMKLRFPYAPGTRPSW
jgi:alpha-glucuronidase